MDLFENWAEVKSTLLEGLNPSQAKIVAPLLENQKEYLLAETAAAGAVTAGDIAGFRKILIPMIRRVIPGTIATELVGVQPMTGPVGLVYSLRYKYNEDATRQTTAANPFFGTGDGSVALGNELFANNPALRHFYSSDIAGAAPVAGASGITSGSEPEISNIDATGQAWGAVSGKSMFDVLASERAFGPLYGGGGGRLEGSGGRKVGLDVISQAVEAGSRKLQAGWTIEAMQDIQAQHGIDLESELTQAMSAEIVQEIDSEILADLVGLAGTVGTWDGTLPGTPGYYTPAYIGDRFANLGAIINMIANEVGRKTRRGQANWMVVSPMTVAVLQTAAKSVFAPAVEGSFKGPNNTMLVGTLNGTIKVYSYLFNQTLALDATSEYSGSSGTVSLIGTGNDTLIMGYKGGNGETDTGYFYCPYIPLMSSGVVINPMTFQPVVSLMTRYGKTTFTNTNTSLGNSKDYYAKITATGVTFA